MGAAGETNCHRCELPQCLTLAEANNRHWTVFGVVAAPFPGHEAGGALLCVCTGQPADGCASLPWEAVRWEWGSDWQGAHGEDGGGNMGSISVPPRSATSRSISYLVGNVINSEHSRLNLVFKLGPIHVTIL